MIGRASLCNGMYPFVSIGKMVNADKKARASFEGALDRQLTGGALSEPMGVMSSRQQPDADPKGKAHGALGIGEE
jgi:hypothetical protein